LHSCRKSGAHRPRWDQTSRLRPVGSPPDGPATNGRLECFKEFPFHAVWNGKYYQNKRVRPIFVEEELEIVVVTVHT